MTCTIAAFFCRLAADHGLGMDPRGLCLLGAMLPLLCGQSMSPSKLVKALTALQAAVEVSVC